MATAATTATAGKSRLRADKPVIFLMCLLPLAWIVLRMFGFAGFSLGPNPVEALIHALGSWGLRLLLITLCVRPVAVVLRQPRVMRLRRMLGLFAFTYLTLHFLPWLVLDQSLNASLIIADIVERPYILVGFTALLLLVPLAVTSTDRWMRRLGRRWHALHRLVYVATLLGCIHFWWQVKADWREPALYVGIYLSLMGWRWRSQQRARKPRPVLDAARNAAATLL